MRVLMDDVTGQSAGRVLNAGALLEAYAAPDSPWLRVNMVSTLDGAATGADGRTGSINNAADKRVFDLLRMTADAVVVGAGTARNEGYGPDRVPIVLVSRTGQVPERLAEGSAGQVLLGTTAAAPGLADARRLLGDDHVLVTGDNEVDLAVLLQELHRRGLRRLLSEGGPTLLRNLLAAEVVDELCVTTVPRMVGGTHPRITTGAPVDVPLRLRLLLEEENTLLSRWFVDR